MRRVIFSIAAVFLLCTVPVAALDWGVVVDSRTTANLVKDQDTEIDLREKVSLWAEEFWNDESGTQYTFSVNGYFLYEKTDPDETIAFDADLLRLKVKKSGLFDDRAVLDASIGRFRFAEPTGIVLSHTADGARAALDYGGIVVRTGVGYTGLQIKPEASVSMTAADAADDADDDVYFAPQRIFEQVEVALPNLVERQRFTLAGLLQQDLRDGDDTLDSVHLIGMADGELSKGLYYTASGTYAIDLSNDLSGLSASGSVYYFSEELLYSRISAGVLYADEDFFTVSTPTLGLVFTPGIADLTRVAFDYSLRPWGDRFDPVVKNLQFSVGTKLFMPAGEYTGSEVTGGVNFKPTSDFGASLKGGVYLPDEGDTAGLLRLDVSLGL